MMAGNLLGPERRFWKNLPWGLLLCAGAIAVVSVVNLASASRAHHTPVWIAQTIWFVLGTLAATLALAVDYRALHRLAWPFYVLVVLLLVAVEVMGTTVMGAQRWLELGPLRLQPSEIAKLSTMFVLARFYAEEGERPGGYTLGELWRPGLIIAVPYALILHQPDLGTASLMAFVAGTLVLAAGVRWKALFSLGAGGVFAAVVGWFFVLKDYQKRRVMTLLDPEADLLGSGYHAHQSMIAVGSGQWAGKGWAQGTQTQLSFLPEQQTDFVFSVFAEEWGLRGALILLALFLGLCVAGLRVAASARDRHGAFLAIGCTALIFWHAFVNIGMVCGILPVVGVTLPLMSYGGSSALTVMACIGLLANVAVRRGTFSA